MRLRKSSYFTIPTFLAVIGILLIQWGVMAPSPGHVAAGWKCLGGALVTLVLVLYLQWQGWIN